MFGILYPGFEKKIGEQETNNNESDVLCERTKITIYRTMMNSEESSGQHVTHEQSN